MSTERIDLGSGHAFTWCGAYSGETAYSVGEHRNLVGIIEWHTKPNGEECGGYVAFAGHGRRNADTGEVGPEWTVVSLDPLHLEPSIHCSPDKGGCGSHGYIRGGRWSDA